MRSSDCLILLAGLAAAGCGAGGRGPGPDRTTPLPADGTHTPADQHLRRSATPATSRRAEDPCLVDCPRHGGHFYGKHEADEGPDVVVIDQLADLYRPVVFAHQLHAGMANMNGGCKNCHHYSETVGRRSRPAASATTRTGRTSTWACPRSRAPTTASASTATSTGATRTPAASATRRPTAPAATCGRTTRPTSSASPTP